MCNIVAVSHDAIYCSLESFEFIMLLNFSATIRIK